MTPERFDIDCSYRDPVDRPDGDLYDDRPSRSELRELDEPLEETPFVDESDQEWGPGLSFDEEAGW